MENSGPRGSSEEDLIPTRGTLLARLKNWQDNASWQQFFDTYWRLIYHFSRQRGLSHDEALEVVQETVVAVAKSIGRLRYDPAVCHFKTWLLAVTRSKIVNQLARRARQPPVLGNASAGGSSTTGVLGRIPDEHGSAWDEAWEQEWEKNLMDTAIQRVKARVSIEQYQMFDLFAIKGWPARDVARTLKVSIGHVYVAKHRLAKLIRKEVEALKAKGA